MARYIDAELAKAEFTGNFCETMHYSCARAIIECVPTADVVSRSEVEKADKEIERLTKILENYALQYGTVTDKQKVIVQAKQEVAREIFEEIESKFHEDDFGDLVIDFMEYQELKKKYIGG